MTQRQARTAAAVALGVAIVALVAWGAGAFAVDYASSPAHEPCPALAQGDHLLRVDTPAGAREVRLHAPRGAFRPLPLVLAVHAADQTGPQFAAATGLSALADRERVLVAYTPATGPNALGSPSSLTQLESAACVNRSRVFLTGGSNTGAATARLGCELSDRLAGIATVGPSRALPLCRRARPQPVVEIQGTARQLAPYAGRAGHRGSATWLAMWRRMDGCARAPVRFTPLVGVHELAWRHCAAATRVEHVTLDGVARGWPGGLRSAPRPAPFAATWRTWEFLRALPPRKPVA